MKFKLDVWYVTLNTWMASIFIRPVRVRFALTGEPLTAPAVRPDCSHVVSAIIQPHVRYSLPLYKGLFSFTSKDQKNVYIITCI